MKILIIFIIVLILASCPDAESELDPETIDLNLLAGKAKPQEQWGIFTVNFPNNIGNAITGDPKTSRTITWQSSLRNGEVIIGQTTYPSTSILYNRQFFHRVDVHGLEPGQSYSYIAGWKDAYSPVYNFKTENADNSAGFTVLHLSDQHVEFINDEESAAVWKRVMESALRTSPNAAFVVNTGDITEDNDEAAILLYFDYAQEILAKLAFVYSLGNNDMPSWYNRYFYTPDSGHGGLMYAFNYGNALFISIDSNVPAYTEDQLVWLENTLKNTNQTWKVGITHDGDYGRNNRNTEITKLFDQYNVDLVMAGHNHFYARSKPIDTEGNEKLNGTVWSIPNAAGTKFNPVSGRNHLAVDEQPNLPMFSEFRFTGTNIYLNAYTVDEEGNASLFDSYTFR